MRLYTFAISHYSEKARFALAYKGIPHDEVTLLPGPHAATVRRIAPKTSLPVLVDGDVVVQGSAEIIDHVEATHPARSLSPSDPDELATCRALESRIDGEIGRALRRAFYWHTLSDRRFATHFFTDGGPWWAQPFYAVAYPRLSATILSAYRVSEERAAKDVDDLEAWLGELEQQLEGNDGRLVGRAFSRADLSLAAMTAHFFRPPEHRIDWPPLERYPAGFRDVMNRFTGGTLETWVRDVYRTHRRAAS